MVLSREHEAIYFPFVLNLTSNIQSSCPSVYYSVMAAGYEPIIADVFAENLSVNPESLPSELMHELKAVVVVHPLGYPVDVKYYRRFGMPVVEDCATVIGSKVREKPAGSWGNISIFSFYATKMITSGEGGAITTNNETLYNFLRECVNSDQPEIPELPHFKFSFTEIQAAQLLDQFCKLPDFISKRKAIFNFYKANIKCQGFKHFYRGDDNQISPTYYRYLLSFDSGERANMFIKHMHNKGVTVAKPVYETLNSVFGSDHECEVADNIWATLISVPIYPGLTMEEQEYIVASINEFSDKFANTMKF